MWKQLVMINQLNTRRQSANWTLQHWQQPSGHQQSTSTILCHPFN